MRFFTAIAAFLLLLPLAHSQSALPMVYMPLEGGTLTGPLVSTSSITAKQLGPVLQADQFTGNDASAKINACITAVQAAHGGVCDARMFAGRQTMDQTIEVLPQTELLLPRSADWCWGLSDGTSVGIQQDSSSAIVGNATGGGGGNMLLTPCNANTRMLALYATQNNPQTGGQYIFASGFNAQNTIGATFTHGVVYTRYTFDESRFERITAINNTGDGWHILGTCCDTNFIDDQADSNYGSAGGTPLVVEGASSFSWSGTINFAGTGHPNIDIQGGNYQLDFWNTYAETNGSNADLSAPVVKIVGNPTVRFHGGVVNMDSAKPCFSNPASVAMNNNWCTNSMIPPEGASCAVNSTIFGTDNNYLYVCAANRVKRVELR